MVKNKMVVDTITSLMPHGLPLVGGGIMGFVIGYFLKKMLKIIILGIGLVFALITFLQYKKWIAVDWATVQHQTGTFLQHSTQQVLNAVNNTAQTLEHQNLNHLDISYPSLGVTGFVPGFILGVIRG
jgi:uncharacterized membrane protein (Fun14 family)